MPYIGRSTDGFGVRNRFLYLASASDTSVSGADVNGAILSFSDGAYVDVYLNGVLLKAGTDYNTNTANTIAGLSAMASNDEVTVIVYDIFAVADTVSQSSGGTFSGAITFDSTVSGLDVNGTEIILDADGDTTITADTDDQIDIKIAGADDFQFTANTFTALSGSSIATNTISETTSGSGVTIDSVLLKDGGIDVNGNEIILDADADTSITADTDDRIDFKAANTDIVHILSTGMGIGTNNPAHTLDLKASAPEIMLEETSSGGSKRLSLGVASDGTPFINAEQSGGIIDVNLTGSHIARFHSEGVIAQNSNSTSNFPLQSKSNNASASASYSLYLMQLTNHYDTTSNFIQAAFYGSGTNFNRFIVHSNGTVQNTTGTYGTISDERLKSDITDAKSQWDDIKNIRVRNFKKYDTGDLIQIGLVAQELEKVSPNLVEEVAPSEADIKHNSVFGTVYEDGDDIPDGKEVGNRKEIKEKVKGVKYSILYMKAVKALQEAMTRIETLEAKVKALEEA